MRWWWAATPAESRTHETIIHPTGHRQASLPRTLHGHGSIGLGGSPADAASPVISFEVLRFADTQPRELLDDSTL